MADLAYIDPSKKPLAVSGTTATSQIPAAGGTATATTGELVGGQYNTTQPTLTNGNQAPLQLDSRGAVRTILCSPDSTNTVAVTSTGSDGLAASQSLSVRAQEYRFNGTTWDRAKKPNAAARLPTSAASTNATSARAATADLFAVTCYNTTASVIYFKIYNKASAPTVGTDVPVLTFAIPPNGGFVHSWSNGFYFGTGIAFALTTGAADSDTGAVTAGAIVGLNISYQ